MGRAQLPSADHALGCINSYLGLNVIGFVRSDHNVLRLGSIPSLLETFFGLVYGYITYTEQGQTVVLQIQNGRYQRQGTFRFSTLQPPSYTYRMAPLIYLAFIYLINKTPQCSCAVVCFYSCYIAAVLAWHE